MPLHSLLVLLAFATCGLVLLVMTFLLKPDNHGLFGNPSIEKFNFYSGKIAIFTCWALFIVKALLPNLGYIQVPEFLSWIATGIAWAGTLIYSFAVIDLGQSLKVGLPDQHTKLKTSGIYRFSRNPIYLAVILIAIGSCLYFPDLINISFAAYGIFIHHKIIKSEEFFLEERFGKEYEYYCHHVRRYI
jgi:protein-S-isoprenylcysteine O-methyltransferase Ste14